MLEQALGTKVGKHVVSNKAKTSRRLLQGSMPLGASCQTAGASLTLALSTPVAQIRRVVLLERVHFRERTAGLSGSLELVRWLLT